MQCNKIINWRVQSVKTPIVRGCRVFLSQELLLAVGWKMAGGCNVSLSKSYCGCGGNGPFGRHTHSLVELLKRNQSFG